MIVNYFQEQLSSLLSFIKRNSYSITQINDGKEVPILTFDTIDEFGFTGQSQTTSYPVESGFRAVDFKYQMPSLVSMKGIISKNASINPISHKKKDLIKSMEDTLEILKNNLIVVNITSRTGRKRENYTLKQYFIKESFDNYYLFECDMQFEEVLIIKNAKMADIKSDTVSSGLSQIKVV